MNFGEIFASHLTSILLYGGSLLATVLILIAIILIHERLINSWRNKKIEKYPSEEEVDDEDEEEYY